MSKVVRPRSRAQSPDLHRANDGAAGPPMQDLAVFDSPPTGAVENSMSIHMLQNNDSDSCCLMVSCCRLHFGMLSLCSSLWWVVFLGHSPRFFETTRNCCTNFETASCWPKHVRIHPAAKKAAAIIYLYLDTICLGVHFCIPRHAGEIQFFLRSSDFEFGGYLISLLSWLFWLFCLSSHILVITLDFRLM